MLTKKTSEDVLKILHHSLGIEHADTSSPYWPETVVSVERDTARRAYRCYFTDGHGRLRNELVNDSVTMPSEEGLMLFTAADESDEGGIDPSSLLADSGQDATEMICPVPPETTTTCAGDIMYGAVVQDAMAEWLSDAMDMHAQVAKNYGVSAPTGGILYKDWLTANRLGEPNHDSAAWTAEVKRRVKEREEATRADRAVRVQGEED